MQKNCFRKCLLEYQIRYAIEKKNFGANLILLTHQKNACHRIFINGNCMTSIFVDKKFIFFYDDTSNFEQKQEKNL